MRKGRVALGFWLLVIVTLVTSSATYAWLSMNLSVLTGGIAVSARSDSKYLQISAHPQEGYGEAVSFGREDDIFGTSTDVEEIFLTTYGYLPAAGGLTIEATLITVENADSLGFTEGTFSGVGRLHASRNSAITTTATSFEDVTSALTPGDSVFGLYLIRSGNYHATAQGKDQNGEDLNYYYKSERTDGGIDYVCVGSFSEGEILSGRRYWGYAIADTEQSAEEEKMLNIVSIDLPAEGYALKRQVYLRAAGGSLDLRDLKVESVKVKGLRNYLTDAMQIMFVAKSSFGGEELVFFYDHAHPELFHGELFDYMLGDRAETISVDIYIFFDGTHANAYSENSVMSNHSVEICFTVDNQD